MLDGRHLFSLLCPLTCSISITFHTFLHNLSFRSYFHHSETGRSQWNPPRFLRSPAQVQAFLAANRDKEEGEEGENEPETSPLLLPKAISVSTLNLVPSFVISFLFFILKHSAFFLREHNQMPKGTFPQNIFFLLQRLGTPAKNGRSVLQLPFGLNR